jgi:tetratricopeptide (TPR) repeat protein
MRGEPRRNHNAIVPIPSRSHDPAVRAKRGIRCRGDEDVSRARCGTRTRRRRCRRYAPKQRLDGPASRAGTSSSGLCDTRLVGLGEGEESATEASPAAVVSRLLGEADAFFEEQKLSEALATCRHVLATFGRQQDQAVDERLAYARLLEGIALERLGNGDDGLRAYDDLITAHGDSRDPKIRRHVAWGLWDKAGLLEKLERGEEAEAAYDQLIGRDDQGLSDDLDAKIAWSLRLKGWRLAQAGRSEEAIAAYDEVISRFGGRSDVELRKSVVDTSVNKAALLGELRRADESMAAYDEALALALLADAPDPGLRDRAVMALSSKASALRALHRKEEASVVNRSVVDAHRAAKAAGGGAKESLISAVGALIAQVALLCDLDRDVEARQLKPELVAILGDVEPAAPPVSVADTTALPEAELAAALAKVIGKGDCWHWFENSDQQPPPELMADRAIELYRLTEPWAFADESAAGDAAQFAASMLRDIADGYAMLVRRLDPTRRKGLPLPQRAESQRKQLLETFAVREWAADLGHPLALEEPTEGVDDIKTCAQPPVDAETREIDAEVETFVHFFLTSIYQRELIAVLCDSPLGREVLTHDNLQQLASYDIAHARRWVRYVVRQLPPDAAGAAVASLFLAQGFFLATHDPPTSSARLFPADPLLRARLRDARVYDWLADQGAELPAFPTDAA